MIVLHGDERIDLFPAKISPLEIVDGSCRIRLMSSVGDDYIFISIPLLACNFDRVLGYEYLSAVYVSDSWQEGALTKIKFKPNNEVLDVGYAFPISTLVSSESCLYKEASNEFERGYALGGVLDLLAGSVGQLGQKEIAWGQCYGLLDFYRDDIVLAVFGRDKIAGDVVAAKEVVSNLFASFADVKAFNVELIGQDYFSSSESHSLINRDVLRAYMPSACIINKQAIQFLRTHVAKAELLKGSPVIRFFLQYQFFELLMQEIFSGVMTNFLAEVVRAEYSTEPWKVKDLVSRLNEKSGDAYRMGRIFGFLKEKYEVETGLIYECCEDLLRKLGKFDRDLEMASGKEGRAYYRVRNIIFHGYGAHGIEDNDIANICDAVSDIIFKLALHFEDFSPYFGGDNAMLAGSTA